MALSDPNPKKPAADLLRRTLASQDIAPDAGVETCPDPEILAAYAEHTLDADETPRYELHFAQCASCRDQIAAMVRAAAPVPRPPRLSWIWTWGWITVAPVTAVLLIAAVFIARQSKRETVSVAPEHPLVAMSRSDESKADVGVSPSDTPQKSPLSAPGEALFAPAIRAKPAIPPHAPSALGAAEASGKADVTAVPKSEVAQTEISNPAAESDLKKPSITHLPMAGRNYTELTQLSPAPAAPQPGKSPDDRSRDQARAQSQTVTVQSETQTLATEAPTLADNGAVAGGVAPSSAPNKTRQATTSARGNAIGYGFGAATQTVTVESAVDRSARTLVQSPDPQVLWRISGGRFVERSTDAGATWRTQWTNASAHVVAGSAPSADTCWLVGRSGIVMVTTDANKWHTITPPADVDFANVSASDASSATITTADGRQFKTRDGGKHWTPAP